MRRDKNKVPQNFEAGRAQPQINPNNRRTKQMNRRNRKLKNKIKGKLMHGNDMHFEWKQK